MNKDVESPEKLYVKVSIACADNRRDIVIYRAKGIEGANEAMKSKYLDLQTGEVLSAKQLLAFEKGKDQIWKAADELYSLLANIADDKEEEANRLLVEAEAIRHCLKEYDAAEDSLDTRTNISWRTGGELRA